MYRKHNSVCKPYDDFLDRSNGFISRTVTEQLKTASPPFQFLSLAHGFPLSIRPVHDAGSFFNGLTWLFSMMDIFSFWRNFHKHGSIGEHTHPVKSTITIFSRFLEDKVRDLLSDCGCCWIGMSQNTCVLIVGMRFMCYQRSHFYSYRYCCPEIKFRSLQSTCNVVWW